MGKIICKIVLSGSILMFCFSGSRAQNIMPLGKYTFTVQPLQLAFQELSGNLEHTLGRNTIGIIGAYRFQTTWDQYTNGPYYNYSRQFTQERYMVSAYHAYTVGLNAKHYLRSERNCYLEAILFYRNWWDDNEFKSTASPQQTVTLRDIVHVYGMKLLMGHTTVFPERGRLRLVVHKYFGLGIRQRKYAPYPNDAAVPAARYHTIDGKEGVTVTVQLGFSLGFSIYPKAAPVQQ
ncbi:MAG TPA: hypothetical protein VL092_12210 [Chitinophagaceae bacterium]|nr:hypothetical protein [Chitinophagaceae bacterium]